MGLDLRSPLRDCNTRDYANGLAAVSAGDVVAEENQLGIVVEDIAASASGVIVTYAPKIVVAKKTGVTIARGDIVYVDTSDGAVSNVGVAGYYKCGFATEAAGSSTTTIEIEFDGNLSEGTAETT